MIQFLALNDAKKIDYWWHDLMQYGISKTMDREQETIIILRTFIDYFYNNFTTDNFSGVELKNFIKTNPIKYRKWYEYVLDFLEKNTNTERPLILGQLYIYKSAHRKIKCKNHTTPVSIPPNQMRDIEKVVCHCGKNIELISSVFHIE